jgi:Flp pilus assembly pilin Flp
MALNQRSRPTAKRFQRLYDFVLDEGAQDVIEYALIAGFIGIAGVVVMGGIHDAVGVVYNSWIDPAAGVPSLWDPSPPLASGS